MDRVADRLDENHNTIEHCKWCDKDFTVHWWLDTGHPHCWMPDLKNYGDCPLCGHERYNYGPEDIKRYEETTARIMAKKAGTYKYPSDITIEDWWEDRLEEAIRMYDPLVKDQE